MEQTIKNGVDGIMHLGSPILIFHMRIVHIWGLNGVIIEHIVFDQISNKHFVHIGI